MCIMSIYPHTDFFGMGVGTGVSYKIICVRINSITPVPKMGTLY